MKRTKNRKHEPVQLPADHASLETTGPGLSSGMPDPWLDELRKTIKETIKRESKGIIFATIAGSSVLAAILGVAGDFLLVPYKTRYEAKLAFDSKLAELTLQNQNRNLEKRREAYESLDKELEKIGRTLRTYVSTCEQVKNDPTAKGYVAFAQASWDSLTNELGDVTTAKNASGSVNLDDQDTPKAVGDVLKRLATNLFSPAVQKNKERNPELALAMEEIEDSIDKIRKQINGKKTGLTLTSSAPTPSN